ncbi:hypothetical protein RRG08_024899 [Elysia crispata]|nr:hypothetical protein RRG08_024899 [Elysia crispata]
MNAKLIALGISYRLCETSVKQRDTLATTSCRQGLPDAALSRVNLDMTSRGRYRATNQCHLSSQQAETRRND